MAGSTDAVIVASARWARARCRATCVLLAIVLTLAFAVPQVRADATAWAALKEPGTHAIMRHALAPGTSDPEGFQLRNCASQRNLDDRGRDQARRIGDLVRENGVTIDRVMSSQWCRCLDTARLLNLGAVEELPALNSFFGNRSQRGPQTEALRAFLDDIPPGQTLMLVTHQVNISALTGRGTTSGEIVVFRYGEDGTVEVKGRIRTSARNGTVN